jgi:hypothetical protein
VPNLPFEANSFAPLHLIDAERGTRRGNIPAALVFGTARRRSFFPPILQ